MLPYDADVSIRQHTPAYVSIRRCIRQQTCGCGDTSDDEGLREGLGGALSSGTQFTCFTSTSGCGDTSDDEGLREGLGGALLSGTQFTCFTSTKASKLST
jgi:hypothetical protein